MINHLLGHATIDADIFTRDGASILDDNLYHAIP
jgi:hypothetical protein